MLNTVPLPELRSSSCPARHAGPISSVFGSLGFPRFLLPNSYSPIRGDFQRPREVIRVVYDFHFLHTGRPPCPRLTAARTPTLPDSDRPCEPRHREAAPQSRGSGAGLRVYTRQGMVHTRQRPGRPPHGVALRKSIRLRESESSAIMAPWDPCPNFGTLELHTRPGGGGGLAEGLPERGATRPSSARAWPPGILAREARGRPDPCSL